MADPLSPLGSPGQVSSMFVAAQPAPAPKPSIAAPAKEAANAVKPNKEDVKAKDASEPSLLDALGEASSERSADPGELKQATETLMDYLKGLPSDLSFKVDESSGYTILSLVNPVTREVVRQFPPEEVLKMARKLKETLDSKEGQGLLLDQKL